MGRLTSGRRKDATVRLDNSQELIISIQLQVRHVGRWATVDNKLVEHFELLTLLHLTAEHAIPVYGASEPHA